MISGFSAMDRIDEKESREVCCIEKIWSSAYACKSPAGWSHWLLIRRNVKKPDEVSFYIVFRPDKKSLSPMVKAARTRWTIEECFEMAKVETGLDHYEVRSWKGWYRYVTFSMFALYFLSGCVPG